MPKKTLAEKRSEAGRKAALTRKRRQAGVKAALTKKRRAAGKKAAATRAAKKSAAPTTLNASPESICMEWDPDEQEWEVAEPTTFEDVYRFKFGEHSQEADVLSHVAPVKPRRR